MKLGDWYLEYLGDLIFIILGKILNFSLQNIQNE